MQFLGDDLTSLKIETRLIENIRDIVNMPASRIKYLKERFDAAGVNYGISGTSSISECNSLLFHGTVLTLNSRTKYYFFHVPADIFTSERKRDNLVKAVETLAA